MNDFLLVITRCGEVSDGLHNDDSIEAIGTKLRPACCTAPRHVLHAAQPTTDGEASENFLDVAHV